MSIQPPEYRGQLVADARDPLRLILPVSIGRPFGPADCLRLADDLERAIARFERWNLPVKEKGRLRRAVGLLRRVGKQDRFNLDPDELPLVANAVVVAGDFSQVAYFLDDRDVESIFHELVVAMKGSLLETDGQTPYNLQSQLWFGTLLARARLQVRVPRVDRGRRPDFVITFAGLDFGVEVKRPETPHSASGLIESAAGQIRQYGGPGIIVVDIGHCLSAREFMLSLIDEQELAPKLVDARFKAVTEDLDRQIRYGDYDRYGHVVAMIAYCKFPYWRDRSDLTMRFATMFGLPPYDRAHGGLLVDRTGRLRLRFRDAMHEFLGQPVWSGTTPVPAKRPR